MSVAQAQRFAETYSVADFYNSPSTDLQAVVFSDGDGRRYLAIRGTSSFSDLVTDAIDIALLGSANLQPQYRSLKAKVVAWIADGTLSSTFTVTGHSLGGFLAGALAVDFPNNVSHAYLYDAPGVGGAAATLPSGLKSLLGLANQPTLDISRVSNIRSDAGISPIAGLGVAWGVPISINIENQLDPALIPNVPAALNHSLQPLSDSASLYATFSRLAPTASVTEIRDIFKAASPANSKTLESTLDSLRRIFVGADIAATPAGDRNAFHSNIGVLNAAITNDSHAGTFELRPIPDGTSIAWKATQNNAEGLSYRYALRELNPFVLVGAAAVYSGHNANGGLDLYDPIGQSGTLTEAWIRDRSELLAWRRLKNDGDIADDIAVLRRDNGPESYLYTDLTLKNAAGQDYNIRVQGGSALQQIDPKRITFGSDQTDVVTGSTYDDRLYGGAGGDSIAGGEGNDYLEGGTGSDIYVYHSANALGGYDTIRDADGEGVIVYNNQPLTGGHKTTGNHYVSEDGNTIYSFVGNLGTGGTLIINDAIEVRDFRNADLGITLNPAADLVAPGAFAYHYVGRDLPYAELGTGYPVSGHPDARFYQGTDFNDEYRAATAYAGTTPVEGGSPGYFAGKGGNDLFLGSYAYGGEWASGGPGNDALYGQALGESLLQLEPADHPLAGDLLNGGAGQDAIVGSRLDDQLFGDFGTISAFGFDGPLMEGYHGYVDMAFTWNPNSNDIQAGGWGSPAETVVGNSMVDVRHFSTSGEFLDYVLGIDSNSKLDTHYDDFVDGGAGDDRIVGGNGSDTLIGGAGDDTIIGDYELNMYRAPELLNPRGQRAFGDYAYLFGRPGDDYIHGGEGNDTISDLFGGNDYMDGGAGDDTIFHINQEPLGAFYQDGEVPVWQSAVDIIDGGDGNDSITSISYVSNGSVEVYGGDGDDVILSVAHAAYVSGGPGNDRMDAFDAHSLQIDGGSGDDLISAAATFIEITAGPGSDVIVAEGFEELHIDQGGNSSGDVDVLRLSQWNASDVDFERVDDDLLLTNDSLGSSVSVVDWFADPEHDLESIEFADAATWTTADVADMFARLADAPIPTNGDDALFASSAFPVVMATDGDDRLEGLNSNVVLDGRAGNDILTLRRNAGGVLVGGSGDDEVHSVTPATVVVFNRGDGIDRVAIGSGTISLGGGIATGDITFSLSEQGIEMSAGGSDRLVLLSDSSAAQSTSPPELRLQVVTPSGIGLYDLFTPLSLFFARALENPDAGPWTPGTDWNDFLLASSVDRAVGGIIAYTYATQGSIADVGAEVLREALGDAEFGMAPQLFARAPAATDDGEPSSPQGEPDQTPVTEEDSDDSALGLPPADSGTEANDTALSDPALSEESPSEEAEFAEPASDETASEETASEETASEETASGETASAETASGDPASGETHAPSTASPDEEPAQESEDDPWTDNTISSSHPEAAGGVSQAGDGLDPQVPEGDGPGASTVTAPSPEQNAGNPSTAVAAPEMERLPPSLAIENISSPQENAGGGSDELTGNATVDSDAVESPPPDELAEGRPAASELSNAIFISDESVDAIAAVQSALVLASTTHVVLPWEDQRSELAKSPSGFDKAAPTDWFAGAQASDGATDLVSMQVMLDAGRAFEMSAQATTGNTAAEGSRTAELDRQSNITPADDTTLDHWSYTNALVNFQLAGSGLPPSGDDASWERGVGLLTPGFGLATALPVLSSGVSVELQNLSRQLQSFAGIQEGFANLN